MGIVQPMSVTSNTRLATRLEVNRPCEARDLGRQPDFVILGVAA